MAELSIQFPFYKALMRKWLHISTWAAKQIKDITNVLFNFWLCQTRCQKSLEQAFQTFVNKDRRRKHWEGWLMGISIYSKVRTIELSIRRWERLKLGQSDTSTLKIKSISANPTESLLELTDNSTAPSSVEFLGKQGCFSLQVHSDSLQWVFGNICEIKLCII